MAAVIFLVALTVRLVHLWQMEAAPVFSVLMGDARSYDEWARQIAAGNWVGKEVFYQAPLYPYFLGAIYSTLGRDLFVVRVIQAVVGAAACTMLGLAAARLSSRRIGLIAGLGLALYAPAIFFDALIQKTVLDVFFVCLTLWIASRLVDAAPRPHEWIGLGLALGALALTRENALVLAAVVLVWIAIAAGPAFATSPLRRGKQASGTRPTIEARTAAAGAFVLGLALVLVPVAGRNYAVGGGFYVTTSQFGPNFYIGNNPRADGTYMSLRPGRGAPEYERQDATDLAERALGRRLAPSEVSRYWTDRALGFITAQPGAWARLLARKFVLLWNADEMLDTESQETHAERSMVLALLGWLGHFGLLVPLAVVGLIASWRDRRRLWLFYAMTIAYSASVIVFYVFARYRFPLVPFLMLFASVGIVQGPSFVRASSRFHRAAVAAIVIAVAIFANWPVLSAETMRAVTETNLGAALQEGGRLDAAIEHYRRAVAIKSDHAPAYNNMGTALRAQGRVDAAVAAYERALETMPDYAEAHFNLGNALMELNRGDEATEHLLIAVRTLPSSAGVHNNLGKALADKGRLEEAAALLGQAVALDPRSARAHRNLGNVLASQGRFEEALVHLRRAVEIEPSDAESGYDLGTVLLEARRLNEAVVVFQAALRNRPDYAEAHNNLGIALGSQGKVAEAIGHFERALHLKPDFADAQRNLEMARKAMNRVC
jgi:tetratricopeptide (TPR) repeat protein